MQFCNTSIRQRGQRSVALNHYLVARRTSTNHGTKQSALTQKLRQSTNYIYSLADGLLACTRSWPFLLNGSIFSVQKLRGVRRLSPLLVTHLATLTIGHMISSWSFCCKCKPVDSSRGPRNEKFGMVREMCNQQQNALLIG